MVCLPKAKRPVLTLPRASSSTGNTDITSEGLLDIISAMVEPRQDASGKWVYNPNMKKLVLDGELQPLHPPTPPCASPNSCSYPLLVTPNGPKAE